MDRRRVKFIIPQNGMTDPFIYRMGKEFQVVTNMRRAHVLADHSWVILEVSGDEPEVDAALDWVRGLGVAVESVEEDQ